jgi:hypothetical protein
MGARQQGGWGVLRCATSFWHVEACAMFKVRDLNLSGELVIAVLERR